MTNTTTAATVRDLVHAGTTNDERTQTRRRLVPRNRLGLSGTTTGSTDTGFIREPAGTLNSMRTGGTSYYYLTDATGNVLGLVNDAGTRTHAYSYSPTGTLRTTPAETVVQPYRYAGAYADPTGLYRMGARYCDPVNNTDPTGLWTAWDTVATGLVAVALVTAIPTGGLIDGCRRHRTGMS
ncbi:hypothetical protein [Streptomyces niveus]|uniref:hypothetical protein n=1 Tax=Streptomyces niveus TaxID=193462 RepID=UPI0034230A33